MSEPTYTWVDTPEALARLVERLADVDEVALDTEFVFERTYWPRPGVVQLAADGEIALVDAVGLDLVSLAEVVGSSTVRKLIHAGSGDAVVLERTTGVRPAGVFDTQIAAAFAGLGAGISYEALVRTLLGVSLGKHHTRTDWTRRPLSTEQLHYAAEDVLHLGTVAAELRARLVALGRLAWAEEDSVASMAVDPGADDPRASLDANPGRGALAARGAGARAGAGRVARPRGARARPAQDLPAARRVAARARVAAGPRSRGARRGAWLRGAPPRPVRAGGGRRARAGGGGAGRGRRRGRRGRRRARSIAPSRARWRRSPPSSRCRPSSCCRGGAAPGSSPASQRANRRRAGSSDGGATCWGRRSTARSAADRARTGCRARGSGVSPPIGYGYRKSPIFLLDLSPSRRHLAPREPDRISVRARNPNEEPDP
ncbi:MAG: ribonuclease D [Deltaproteobacteria bacterium]|nr:ribonuclease D [Deltaproteobacteria bacterium]